MNFKLTKMVTFTASHLSSNENILFPDKISIDSDKLRYFKGFLFGYRSKIVTLSNIASVSISSGILFADIIIESKGGEKIVGKGFLRSDAKRIESMLV